MASGVLTVYVNHKKLNRNNPPAYSEHSGSKMDLVSSGSPMTSTARASRHFLSPYVTWPLSLQHLTLLTSLCLPRQYTPDFWSSPSPLPIISSACPQMPMVCPLSLLSHYILSLSISLAPLIYQTPIYRRFRNVSLTLPSSHFSHHLYPRVYETGLLECFTGTLNNVQT